jgi:hypothetical protein
MQRTPNCSIVLTLAIMFLPFDYCAKPTNLLYRCNDGTQSHRFITLFHAIVKVALYISYKAITMFISLLGLWCIMPLSPICNQCLSQLTLRVGILLRRGMLDTTLCDKIFVTCGRSVFSGYSDFLHQ